MTTVFAVKIEYEFIIDSTLLCDHIYVFLAMLCFWPPLQMESAARGDRVAGMLLNEIINHPLS